MKRRKKGFTLVELLTVVTIIALLIAVLVPSLAMVRRVAKETQQKSQLTAMDLALTAFKNDYGDYPPSINDNGDYCGAQKLAEALLGWDLMGFHPDSDWQADGKDIADSKLIYDATIDSNLKQRRGPYLELETTNAFKLGDLYGTPTTNLELNTFVICDAFGVKTVSLSNRVVKAGTPVLYYKANTASKSFDDTNPDWSKLIYNAEDNLEIIRLKKLPKCQDDHKLVGPNPDVGGSGDPGAYLYSRDYKVVDPKINIPNMDWPHRPDSYILISAGADSEYGTSDAICNF